MTYKQILLASAAAGTVFATPAFAQEADDGDYSVKADIVVTGTLVRGIAPAGTNVVGVSDEDVESSGATTVSELLTTVPQFGKFNDLETISGGGNFVTTNRPNLRNLPGFTTTGTSATLMLVDGHRVVGMGISSTTPDADFVPTGIIERVEIVPDGGSALYGSDAVAGVVNFITNKRFDGVKVGARYGFGKQYHTFDANATVGKAWDDGSVWVSYNYAENGSILGRDRSYNFAPETTVAGTIVRSTECALPNVLVGGVPLGIPGLNPPASALYAAPVTVGGAGTSNICDQTDYAALYPKQERHSVYAGLNQQLNDWLEADIRAYYYRKESLFDIGQYYTSVNIGPSFLAPFGFTSSPFATFVTGYPGETQQVNFALSPDYISKQTVTLDSWGFRPSFKADIGGGWQARFDASYSESKSISHNQRIAPPATIIPLVASGAFNPYAPLTASPDVIAQLTNYETYGRADQTQFDVRLIADGDLFALPGGMAKVAVGAEYLEETYDSRKGDTVPANYLNIPKFNQKRDVKSVFGELVLPLFKTDGGMSLTVSASGRYDDYSDVGDTFNPKFGATFKPVDWVSIRGAWGESFVAPSLADGAIADPTNLNWITGGTLGFIAPTQVLLGNGFPEPQPGQYIMFLLGANPGLKPQSATTWSIGADIEPPFAPGLRLSGTYYNIDYKDLIQLVPFINQQQFFSTFADSAFTLNPTQAQIDATIASAGIITGAPCGPQPSCVYGIQDVRKRNLGGFRTDGIDFAVDYRTDTGFGSVDFSVNGTYILDRKFAPVSGGAFRPDAPFSDLKVRSAIGANVGDLRAQASWNFSRGYDLDVPVGLSNQTHVGSFSTVDIYLKYDLADVISSTEELALTVTVNNLFDEYPPLYDVGGEPVRNQSGFRNGNTVGRLVQVGISTKF